jgi:hypothetical protein
MGIEPVRGRTFAASDFLGNYVPPPVVSGPGSRKIIDFIRRTGPYVINEAFAKQYFPNADPLVTTSPIVGIVRNAKLLGVGPEIAPLMFLPARSPRMEAIIVRTAGEAGVITSAIRDAIQAVHPRLLVGVTTVGEAMNRNIAKERMVAAISAFFGVLGLALACIGIFGVASSTVASRAKELGIRRALGAGGWSVIRESLRETLLVVALGITAGGVAAFVAVRLTASLIADLLYGLTATDARNLVAAVAVMIVAALAACALPALRATRVDPLVAIRDE